jgi:DNA-directed RNA polymerase subunit K/omega
VHATRSVMTILTPYEIARVVGIRSLQLSSGALPAVDVRDERLLLDTSYVAALELQQGALDFKLRLSDGVEVDVRSARKHPCLAGFLDTKDGGTRS